MQVCNFKYDNKVSGLPDDMKKKHVPFVQALYQQFSGVASADT